MEEDRYKRTDDNQLLLMSPKSADSVPDSTQENDGTFQVNDTEAENAPLNGVKNDYHEETAAEIAAPRVNRVNDNINETYDRTEGSSTGGTIVGGISLILSILSLFMMPFLFGILGIIGGFISRSRGAKSLGSWAIGIGAISIIIGIFILPFF